jgi:hypothetical protein
MPSAKPLRPSPAPSSVPVRHRGRARAPRMRSPQTVRSRSPPRPGRSSRLFACYAVPARLPSAGRRSRTGRPARHHSGPPLSGRHRFRRSDPAALPLEVRQAHDPVYDSCTSGAATLPRQGQCSKAVSRITRGDLPIPGDLVCGRIDPFGEPRYTRADQPEPGRRETTSGRRPAVADRPGRGQAERAATRPLQPDPRAEESGARLHERTIGLEVAFEATCKRVRDVNCRLRRFRDPLSTSFRRRRGRHERTRLAAARIER